MIIERTYLAGKYLEYNVRTHFTGMLEEESDLLFIQGNILEETDCGRRDETNDQDRDPAVGKFVMIPTDIRSLSCTVTL